MRRNPVVFMSILVLGSLNAFAAQIPGAQPAPPPDDTVIRAQKEQAKKRNQERQASLKRDTDKLFDLATELKHYVDRSNENVLSVDVVRKADEIEKLAHSVKEKMKGY